MPGCRASAPWSLRASPFRPSKKNDRSRFLERMILSQFCYPRSYALWVSRPQAAPLMLWILSEPASRHAEERIVQLLIALASTAAQPSHTNVAKSLSRWRSMRGSGRCQNAETLHVSFPPYPQSQREPAECESSLLERRFALRFLRGRLLPDADFPVTSDLILRARLKSIAIASGAMCDVNQPVAPILIVRVAVDKNMDKYGNFNCRRYKNQHHYFYKRAPYGFLLRCVLPAHSGNLSEIS